jgi:hypothetical protein
MTFEVYKAQAVSLYLFSQADIDLPSKIYSEKLLLLITVSC